MRVSPAYALVALTLAAPGTASAQNFSVKRSTDDSVAYSGMLSAELKDRATTVPVQFADFSALDEPGEYYVEVPSIGRSVAFRIGKDVYDGELANVMLGFYGWRSGVDIAFEHHGVHYEHKAGHLNDALLDYVDGQTGVRKDGTGGWYDAGDYGKYLPTAAESVNTMLAAWELFSDKLRHLKLPFIPEHGSELPDYLSELKWELDWMLKMAYDDGSGRVHHKLNSPNFPGFVLPEDDRTTRYFSDYSSAATAEFVATMAKAARAFAPYDSITDGYSERLLQAAALSYAYLKAHPENVQYDSSVLSAGEYQKMGNDDRIWAAAEYWETTGDETALADFESRVDTATKFVPNFDWDSTTNFGLLTYVLSQRPGKNAELAAALEARLQEVAASLVTSSKSSGYGRNLNMFYWGTNGVIARTCMLLHSANVLEPTPAYLDSCAEQVAWLYGRNQYNRSQVTGAGIAPPLEPHHRISGADEAEQPYPGLLVGGGQNAVNWSDLQGSFATNEVAINWNAALVYALAGFIQGEDAVPSLGRGPVAAADCGVRVSSIGYVPERSKVATVQTDCELPSLFQCEMKPETLSGDTSGPAVLIDDLEDGDVQISAKDGRQGGWFAFDDNSGGTRTDVELKPAERDGSTHAACISGQGFTSWGGGMGFPLSGSETSRVAYDASSYTGLTFWARGSGSQIRAMFVDKYSDPAGALCSGCYDHFQATFTPTSEWKQYTFTWKELKQLGFGDAQPSVCAAALYAVQFQWLAGSPFELCVDDVAFTTPEGFAMPEPLPTEMEQPPVEAVPGMRPGGGGCSCRSTGGSSSSHSPLLLGGLALVAWGLRRRAGLRTNRAERVG